MKILVIEDNYYTRNIITRWFTRRGHQVVSSIDGDRCVELARSEEPDIIILDMRLPLISGLEIAQLLKAESDTHDIPVIAITAYRLEETREAALAAGCDEYESKPLDFEKLLEKINSLLAQ